MFITYKGVSALTLNIVDIWCANVLCCQHCVCYCRVQSTLYVFLLCYVNALCDSVLYNQRFVRFCSVQQTFCVHMFSRRLLCFFFLQSTFCVLLFCSVNVLCALFCKSTFYMFLISSVNDLSVSVQYILHFKRRLTYRLFLCKCFFGYINNETQQHRKKSLLKMLTQESALNFYKTYQQIFEELAIFCK